MSGAGMSGAVRNAIRRAVAVPGRLLDPDRVDSRTFLAWTTGGGPLLLGFGAHRILTEPDSGAAWAIGLVAILAGTALLLAFVRYWRRPPTDGPKD